MAKSTLLTTLLLLLAAGVATGKRLYKYQDEEGVWQFSDRKPDTEQPVETQLMRVEEREIVRLTKARQGSEITYSALTHWHGPVALFIDLARGENVQTIPATPAVIVLDGPGKEAVLQLAPVDPTRAWSYELVTEAVPGDPTAEPDDTLYQPPFRFGERWYIGQGFGGSASHNLPQSHHAIDLTMPEGTPVLAARGGLVMNTERDFFGSGTDVDRYGLRANNVRILHDDGTMGVYAHLALESISVRPGQRVEAGELIGLSGNTGYSTGPHLHFVVQRNDQMELRSVPFRFADDTPVGLSPLPGNFLEHRLGVGAVLLAPLR